MNLYSDYDLLCNLFLYITARVGMLAVNLVVYVLGTLIFCYWEMFWMMEGIPLCVVYVIKCVALLFIDGSKEVNQTSISIVFFLFPLFRICWKVCMSLSHLILFIVF